MEGSQRSSTALLLLLLLALMLAASSTTALAAAEQGRQPPAAHWGYNDDLMLISVRTSLGDQFKLAMREDGSSVAGFANDQNDWFAIQGSEDLLQPYRERYGGGDDDIPGHGILALLGGMLK